MRDTHPDRLRGGVGSRQARVASASDARRTATWLGVLESKRISRLGRDRRLYLGWWRGILAGGELPDTVHGRALPSIGTVVFEIAGPLTNKASTTTVVVHGRDGRRPHLYVPARLAAEVHLREQSWIVVSSTPTRIVLRAC